MGLKNTGNNKTDGGLTNQLGTAVGIQKKR